ncbi:MAG: PilZ domain-containing protein [Candidatus Omnitrophica bacterium]|nr:PilZ domain-containing protein [Candidatus Omnitrophota bacterium]
MLEVNFKKVKQVGVLNLSGNVDINSSNLVEKVGWALENGYEDLVCDFQEVDLIDYAGMSALALAYKNVANHGGRMKFASVALHIRKVFNLVCLDKVFEIYDDLDTALRSFEEDKTISLIQKKKLRRRFKRLPLDIVIEFKSKKESKFHQGKVLNISGVGMLVFAEKEIYKLGEILDIKLTLRPAPGLLEIEAVVVWLVEKNIQPQLYPAMGLEFYHLDTSTQEKIVEFVERNMSLDNTSEC